MDILKRFLTYTAINSTSNPETGTTPSTTGQLELAIHLTQELGAIGMSEITIDENGYVMATLPSNCEHELPVIGFISHMDTSPDMTTIGIAPQVIKNYDGNDIILNKEENIILSSSYFPEIKNYIGQDIVCTNGKTLLGADDKAGVAEIVTAMEFLINHPEIKHGKIRIGFTPDEEIGQGAHHFDVAKFGADWAYTIDGGQIGELEFENFNAAGAEITIRGRNVHPGYAKGKMVNSQLIANEFIAAMPLDEVPEKTCNYEGFYHLTSILGSVEETKLNYIIRDHDRTKFEARKIFIEDLANSFALKYGAENIQLKLKDQYYNMREKVEPVMHIVDLAEQAMLAVGVTPIIKPIRGGTDGSQLSYMGLPCPNIFAGGHNFHGRFEYIPLQSMEKAVEVIVKIVESMKNIKIKD